MLPTAALGGSLPSGWGRWWKKTPAALSYALAVFSFDISTSRGGLPCRVEGCDSAFIPKSSDSVPDLEDAVLNRDAHELHIHGYQHRKVEPPKWGYGRLKGR